MYFSQVSVRRLKSSVLKSSVSAVVAGASLVALSAAGNCYPTSLPYWGPTGLGVIPTTDTVPEKSFDLGLNYERVNLGIPGHVDYFPVLSGQFGLKRAEIGVGYSREMDRYPGYSADFDDYTINGKYRLYESKRMIGGDNAMGNMAAMAPDANMNATEMAMMNDSTRVPDSAVAIGAQYIKFGGGYGNLTDAYLTGSKVLYHTKNQRTWVRGHLGLIYQNDRAGSNGGLSQNLVRPMLGLEARIGNRLTLAGDYVSEKKASVRLYSFVARYEFKNDLSAQIGYGHYGSPVVPGGADDQRLKLSVAYRFNTK